jgi:hypothetical protein
VRLSPLGTFATIWPIVPVPDDCVCEAIGEMLGNGNGSAGNKISPVPHCSPQIPHHLT